MRRGKRVDLFSPPMVTMVFFLLSLESLMVDACIRTTTGDRWPTVVYSAVSHAPYETGWWVVAELHHHGGLREARRPAKVSRARGRVAVKHGGGVAGVLRVRCVWPCGVRGYSVGLLRANVPGSGSKLHAAVAAFASQNQPPPVPCVLPAGCWRSCSRR
jgi:hypothetical protein